MKAVLDCLPCIARQSLHAARLATSDERLQHKAVTAVLKQLAETELTSTPLLLARPAHRAVREITGCHDPYEALKKASNAEALRLYPAVKEVVEASANPLLAATKMAIAGNIMDFGALTEFDVDATVQKALHTAFATDDFDQFAEAARRADRILYIADNAGEIVFDRVLIEQLAAPHCAVVVKSEPFINDAMPVDAQAAGLHGLAAIIAVPPGDPGTDAFRQAWDSADVIVSKGQANYEGFSEADGPLFFLLIAKCPFIARDAGVEEGDMILKARTPAVP